MLNARNPTFKAKTLSPLKALVFGLAKFLGKPKWNNVNNNQVA